MSNRIEEQGFTLTEACIATMIVGPLMVAFLGATSTVGSAIDENERSADVTTRTRSVGERLKQVLMRAELDSMQLKPTPLLRVLQSDVPVTPADEDFYLGSEVETGAPKAFPFDAEATQSSRDSQGAPGYGNSSYAVSLLDVGDRTHYVTFHSNWTSYTQHWSADAREPTGWIDVVEYRPTEWLRFATVDGTMSMNASRRTQVQTLKFVRDPRESLNAKDDDGDGMVDEGQLILKRGPVTTVLVDNVEVCTFTLEGQVLRFAIRCCRKDNRGRVHRTTIQKRILIRNRR